MGMHNEEFTCLVVDDSKFARLNIARTVMGIGGKVIGEAENGLQAVELFPKLHPDLVFLDISMPELDGVEALQKILEIDDGAKVIVVSSVGHKNMVMKAVTLGAKHFISKPYDHGYAEVIIKSVVEDGKEA